MEITKGKKCIHCGAVCEQEQPFCHACGKRIQQETINDYGVEQLKYFIGPKSERYIKIFKKNRNKKFFLHMNWAAFFFNIYWAFYRKMYAVGISFVLILMLVVYSIIGIGAGTVKEDYESMMSEITATYEAELSEESEALEIMFEDLPQEVQLSVLANLLPTCTVYIIIASVLSGAMQIGFALVADQLYRNYVFKRINYADGGVSVGATIAALLLEPVAVWIAAIVAINLISVFLF